MATHHGRQEVPIPPAPPQQFQARITPFPAVRWATWWAQLCCDSAVVGRSRNVPFTGAFIACWCHVRFDRGVVLECIRNPFLSTPCCGDTQVQSHFGRCFSAGRRLCADSGFYIAILHGVCRSVFLQAGSVDRTVCPIIWLILMVCVHIVTGDELAKHARRARIDCQGTHDH